MPLKLSKFEPSHLVVLNRWADSHENQVNSHETKINQLHTLLTQIFKQNPTLVDPRAKK